MSGSQSNITRHAKKQKHMTYNEKRQLIEYTQIELVYKLLHIF